MSVALPTYAQAAAFVARRAAELAQTPRITRVELHAAAGSVLAEPIIADAEMPPFPRSTRDGYACRAAEAATHSVLHVAGLIRAGDSPVGPLPVGAAWEIMTGAAVPAGADAVMMLEHVQRDGNTVRLLAPRTLEAGENVVPAGSEAHAGEQVVPVGTRLGAAHIAAAASCGYATVPVFAKPRVAILTTGDELVAVHEKPAAGQIRNSNASMLAAFVAAAGGDPLILPAVKDEASLLDAALSQAREADLLLISGGVSAGKFDLVEPALARLDAKFHFTGARIQPGKPIVFGELPRSQAGSAATLPFFGLPGNPISSAATFLLFAVPVLTALAGSRDVAPRFSVARLERSIKGKPDLTRFVPSTCRDSASPAEPPSVAPAGSQSSGDLAAFARANCFLVVPEGTAQLNGGDYVHVLRF